MSDIDFRRYVGCYTLSFCKRRKFKKELSQRKGRFRKNFKFSNRKLSRQFGKHYYYMMTYIDTRKVKRFKRGLGK